MVHHYHEAQEAPLFLSAKPVRLTTVPELDCESNQNADIPPFAHSGLKFDFATRFAGY